jgi:hypothetical protein
MLRRRLVQLLLPVVSPNEIAQLRVWDEYGPVLVEMLPLKSLLIDVTLKRVHIRRLGQLSFYVKRKCAETSDIDTLTLEKLFMNKFNGSFPDELHL